MWRTGKFLVAAGLIFGFVPLPAAYVFLNIVVFLFSEEFAMFFLPVLFFSMGLTEYVALPAFGIGLLLLLLSWLSEILFLSWQSKGKTGSSFTSHKLKNGND